MPLITEGFFVIVGGILAFALCFDAAIVAFAKGASLAKLAKGPLPSRARRKPSPDAEQLLEEVPF